MPILLRNFAVDFRVGEDALLEHILRRLSLDRDQVAGWRVVGKGLDARKKSAIRYVYAIELSVKDEAACIERFPGDPELYEDLAGTYFEMGWVKESREILNEGLKKFPDHQGLKEMAEELDEGEDDPDGNRPPLLGLILLMTMLGKKLKKK